MAIDRRVRWSSRIRLAFPLALTALSGCHHTASPVFEQLSDARALAAELRVQFGKAVGASDRAVMADTDEASVTHGSSSCDCSQATVQPATVTLEPS